MAETPTINHHLAWYEFRWLAVVGMFTFLIAYAAGSLVVALAGMMIWAAFNVLARRFLYQGNDQSTRTNVNERPRRHAETAPLKERVSVR